MGEYNLSGYNSISSNRFAFYIWISLNILLVGAALRRLNYYLVFFPLLFFLFLLFPFAVWLIELYNRAYRGYISPKM